MYVMYVCGLAGKISAGKDEANGKVLTGRWPLLSQHITSDSCGNERDSIRRQTGKRQVYHHIKKFKIYRPVYWCL